MKSRGKALSAVRSGAVEWSCTQVLCKPKIMPLKSITLERLEEMEKAAMAVMTQQQAEQDQQQFR
jgi:hypothetical protein